MLAAPQRRVQSSTAHDKALQIHVLDGRREVCRDIVHGGKDNQPLDLALKAEILVQDEVALASVVPLHKVAQSLKESHVLPPARVAACVMNIVAILQKGTGLVHKAISNGHRVKEHF